MGTRSLTRIMNESNKELCCIYRQFDGYPTEHGKDLKDFLSDFKIVNGLTFPLPSLEDKVANGMGCLAAQLIKQLKDSSGGIYLNAPEGLNTESFIYIITSTRVGKEYFDNSRGPGQIYLEALYEDKVFYKGLIKDFNPEEAQESLYNNEEE